uniref:Uncharacterized protein n=1 Tax=Echinococcus granulosus TaxID=6210 RepID=A0A068WQ99_ECHGR|nr:hypothetical protein EgrG_002024000 [Echinococcus granulosus]
MLKTTGMSSIYFASKARKYKRRACTLSASSSNSKEVGAFLTNYCANTKRQSRLPPTTETAIHTTGHIAALLQTAKHMASHIASQAQMAMHMAAHIAAPALMATNTASRIAAPLLAAKHTAAHIAAPPQTAMHTDSHIVSITSHVVLLLQLFA